MAAQDVLKNTGFSVQHTNRNTVSKSFPANNAKEIASALETIAKLFRTVESLGDDEINVLYPEFKFEKVESTRGTTSKVLNFAATITNEPF